MEEMRIVISRTNQFGEGFATDWEPFVVTKDEWDCSALLKGLREGDSGFSPEELREEDGPWIYKRDKVFVLE